jgi:hypothetical protein
VIEYVADARLDVVYVATPEANVPEPRRLVLS